MPLSNASAAGADGLGIAVEYNPGATPITAPAAAPTATGSASGGTLPAATYTYQVTFVGGTPVGETTPSTATTGYVATGTTSSVALSVIPTGGTGTTARKIYRSTGSGYFYLTTINDNTTTTYTDTGAVTLGTAQPPTSNTTNIGTPGVPVSPATFAPTTNIGLEAKWATVEPEVMRGTLMTHAILVNDRVDPMGPIEWLANPALLVEAFLLTLGAKTSLNAVTGTTTAANVTANGITTLTVAGTFTPGAMVDIGTGSNLVRSCVLPASTSGSLKVSALPGALATAASGLSVSQVAQDKYANSLLPTTAKSLLPTATFEQIISNGLWSIQYPYMFSNGLSLDFSDKGLKAKMDCVGSAAPNFGSSTGTTPATFISASYAPNGSDEAIALNPFTSINSTIVALGDPDATGTSTVRAANTVTDLKIDFKNDLEKVGVMNGQTAYTYFPSGKASCAVSWNEIATSNRFDVYSDAIAINVGAPLLAGAWKNFGTASSPVYKGLNAYIPFMKFDNQKLDEKVGSVNRFSKSGKSLAPAGSAADYLQIFCQK